MENSLGKKLKETRKNLGLTLRKVEEKSGISNAYLSQLENDKIKNPSATILSRLSEMYNVSINSFLGTEVLSKETNDSEWNFARRVATSSQGMTEEQRNDILRYLEFVKKNHIK